MIEIALNDVHVSFGFKKVLKGVSFEVQTGEKVAIVGRNGSGKTTIFKIIAGLEDYDSGICTTRKAATIGFLEQIAEESISGRKVSNVLLEAHRPIFDMEHRMREIEIQMSQCASDKELNKLMSEYGRLQNQMIAMNGYETEEDFHKICNVFQISDHMLVQPFGELSGGQKTMIKLAKILLEKPDILLLDEPTNHIDISALQWLEGFITGYRGTVVIISHDRYFIDKTVTKTILIENGTSEVFRGNYSFCLREQERLLLEEFERYKNQQKKVTAMKEAIKRFREWGAIGDNSRMFRAAASIEKRLEKMEMIEKPQLEREKLPLNFQMQKRSGKRVVEIEEMSFSFEGNPILEDANMEILFKEKVCLMGKNGSGKTTLIRLIMNQLESDSGKVKVGESVRIGYVEQEIHFENENETILDVFKKDAMVHENEARRILAKYFFIGDDVLKRVGKLSGGEKVIVRLAMLLQKNVNFLILDEPTNHLDIDTKELLEESLSDYNGTLLFISHDRYFINKVHILATFGQGFSQHPAKDSRNIRSGNLATSGQELR